MSSFWLTPAAPGTVAPAHLDKVRELHTTVRGWIEASARTQKNTHLTANLPYIDLMFAFGFATLGDYVTANKLVEDARTVMEGPIPIGGTSQADAEVEAAVVRNLLFRAFQYRIKEALARRPHVGSLSPAVLDALDEIRKVSNQGPVNNPFKLACYAIGRFRHVFRVVEPEESPDPYSEFARHLSSLKHQINVLWQTHDSALVQKISDALRLAAQEKEHEVARIQVLHVALQLAGRVGEEFALELIGLTIEAISSTSLVSKQQKDLPTIQVEALQSALYLAVRYQNVEFVAKLTNQFTTRLERETLELRLEVFSRAGRLFLNACQSMMSREEINQLLKTWQAVVFGGQSLEATLIQYDAKYEIFAKVLSAFEVLAGGWMRQGEAALATSILSTARECFLNPGFRKFSAADHTLIVREYISAYSNDAIENGVGFITEAFSKMSPKAVTNTWHTAPFYSRFHLLLVEDAVSAICRLCLENTVPVTITA